MDVYKAQSPGVLQDCKCFCASLVHKAPYPGIPWYWVRWSCCSSLGLTTLKCQIQTIAFQVQCLHSLRQWKPFATYMFEFSWRVKLVSACAVCINSNKWSWLQLVQIAVAFLRLWGTQWGNGLGMAGIRWVLVVGSPMCLLEVQRFSAEATCHYCQAQVKDKTHWFGTSQLHSDLNSCCCKVIGFLCIVSILFIHESIHPSI